MPFQAGSSGNPAGRPKGIPNRKFLNLGYWHELIEKNMKDLSPKERVRLGQWGMEVILGKMKEIATPDESKANVEETMKLLKEMEAKAKQ